MAHLTLQLGAALVIPFDVPRRMTNTGREWRRRALRAAVASGGAVGMWPAGWPLDDARSLRSRPRRSRQPASPGAPQ
jgi:hypothetical protein